MLFRKYKGASYNIKGDFKVFSTVIILFFYVIGNIPPPFFHSLVYVHDSVVSHAAEQEKDACHVSLYHEGRDGSCEHKTHLVKVEKCSLFHPVLQKDGVTFSNSSSQFVYFYFSINEHMVSCLSHDVAVQLPPRAPPVLFSA